MTNRRTTELWLLIAAVPVLLVFFAMLLITNGAELSVASFSVPIGLAVAFFAAHIAERKFTPNADPAILPIAFVLSGIGITFVLRLAPDSAVKQVVWLFAAIVCMVLTLLFVSSLEKIGRYKYSCLLVGVVLLLSPMLPVIGQEYNGSRIWLSIAGMSFQPGEISKICIVLFLAAYLADNRELLSVLRTTRTGFKLPHLRTLVPLLAMWVVALLIVIFERDLGSALLLFGVFLVMLYVCTGRLSYIIIGLALVAIGATGLYKVFSHVQTRIAIWLDPFADASGSGYQLVQSLYSLADGGLFGVGIGRGLPDYIPFAESDFIFSAIGEEMGLLGGAAVIILFMLFCVRGFLTAARAKSDVAAFTAAGLTTSIAFQAFIIIGGVTGFIPLTGLTLPFMSQGGSSLISSFIIVGLLLRASNEATGLGAEMASTGQFRLLGGDTGVLGRSALGRRLTAVLAVFTILFALLIANLTYIQVFRASELQAMPSNNHTLAKQSQRERGAILSSDGVVLAQSEQQEDGSYTRVYPEGDLAAHAVGYTSSQYGSAGVESKMSSTLVGEDNFETFADALRAAAGEQTSGNDVRLTLNSKIQRTAQEQLAGKKGAVVVLDTKTGAVLAEASAPTYDIGDVGDVLSGTAGGDGELVNRATQTLYAPGSTFKTVTLAAALDTGTVTDDSSYEAPASMDIGNAPVTNYHGQGYGTLTVKEATERSANTVFAQIADQLGSSTLVSYASRFGFNNDIAQDFDLTKSLMPEASEMTEWETAWAGVGQPVGEHASPAGPQTTVMQMATSMAAIANDGVAMRPYLVDSVLSAGGAVVSQTKAQVYGQVMSKAAAQDEQGILRGVVEEGTGSAAAVSDADVIGKTGTAETSDAASDAWFVGTATRGETSVTVAIVIEKGDSGGGVAAPRASEIFACALDELGG